MKKINHENSDNEENLGTDIGKLRIVLILYCNFYNLTRKSNKID